MALAASVRLPKGLLGIEALNILTGLLTQASSVLLTRARGPRGRSGRGRGWSLGRDGERTEPYALAITSAHWLPGRRDSGRPSINDCMRQGCEGAPRRKTNTDATWPQQHLDCDSASIPPSPQPQTHAPPQAQATGRRGRPPLVYTPLSRSSSSSWVMAVGRGLWVVRRAPPVGRRPMSAVRRPPTSVLARCPPSPICRPSSVSSIARSLVSVVRSPSPS